MKKSEIILKKMNELPGKIATEVMLISVISGILAGAIAQMFHVDYWVDMVFWTWAGIALAGLMLDLIMVTVLGVISIFVMKKED